MVCLVCGQYRAPRGRIRGRVDSSATVPIIAGVPLVTAAVVVFRREVIVKVAAFHVGGIVGGCFSATTDGSEGEAVEVGLFVCHVAIVGPLRRRWHRLWPSLRIDHRRGLQGTEDGRQAAGPDHDGGPDR